MLTAHARFIAIFTGLLIPIASAAGITVGVNKLSVVRKSSNGVTIAFPDVCKTPSPAGPIPIPYPNFGKSSDTERGSRRTHDNAILKTTEKARQRELASANDVKSSNVVRYSLEVRAEGRLLIQQSAGKNSVTTATYVDGKGNKLPLREHALIKLANGDLCAICASRDGRVTAVYRLLPDAPKRRSP